MEWVGSEGWWLEQVGFEGWRFGRVGSDVQQQVLSASLFPSTVPNLLVGSLMMTVLNPDQ